MYHNPWKVCHTGARFKIITRHTFVVIMEISPNIVWGVANIIHQPTWQGGGGEVWVAIHSQVTTFFVRFTASCVFHDPLWQSLPHSLGLVFSWLIVSIYTHIVQCQNKRKYTFVHKVYIFCKVFHFCSGMCFFSKEQGRVIVQNMSLQQGGW